MISRTCLPWIAVVSLVACGGTTPAPAPPPKVAPPADAAPTCPTELGQGGDPIEAESYEGKTISRVCILGTEEAKKEAARSVSAKEGDTYSVDRVRADLDALLHLGTLDDASTYGIRAGRDAMMLVYAVHARPRIADIAVTGAKVLGDATLTSKLPLQADARFDPGAVNVFAQAIREEYRTRGYDSCTVTLVSEPAGDPAAGKVKVRIVVTEGPRLYVSKVELKGNAKVKEPDLRKAIAIDDKAPFDRTKIELATQKVSAVYYDRGMIQIRARPSTSSPATDGGIVVTFTVDEGDVYAVGDVHATKLGAPVEKELLDKVVKLRPKQPFSRQTVIDDMERIKAFFAKSKQAVEIVPTTNIDEKKKTVSLTFEIEQAH